MYIYIYAMPKLVAPVRWIIVFVFRKQTTLFESSLLRCGGPCFVFFNSTILFGKQCALVRGKATGGSNISTK